MAIDTVARDAAVESAPATVDAVAARDALAAEWRQANPSTPEEIARFYRDSACLADDLEAFHQRGERRRWTDVLVHIVRTQGARTVVDIGCGVGHDLRALDVAVSSDTLLYGVEPNERLRTALSADFPCLADVEHAPIEAADVLACFDVLEHVVDPETFLGGIAKRAKIGAMLVETVATHDCGTPLHLRENRAWHPGRVLERHGWERIDQEGRLRVWRRCREDAAQTSTLMICARRSLSIPTTRSLLDLVRADPNRWRPVIGGEAGIQRSRNIQVSRWWRETADDVFLMVDDDITFTVQQAEQIVAHCRNGYDVICAAYPVRDGAHLALRGQGRLLTFGPDLPPEPITYAATGFLAVHRRVIDALVETLPLCHSTTPFAYWPMFDFETVWNEAADDYENLSEDYVFSQRAKALGFQTWLDPSILLGHLGEVEITVANMRAVHAAIKGGQ